MRRICSKRAQRHFTIPRSNVQSQAAHKRRHQVAPAGNARVTDPFQLRFLGTQVKGSIRFQLHNNVQPFRFVCAVRRWGIGRPSGRRRRAVFPRKHGSQWPKSRPGHQRYRNGAVQGGTYPGTRAPSSSMVLRRNSANPNSTLQRAPLTRPPIGTPCRCIQTEFPNVANG